MATNEGPTAEAGFQRCSVGQQPVVRAILDIYLSSALDEFIHMDTGASLLVSGSSSFSYLL